MFRGPSNRCVSRLKLNFRVEADRPDVAAKFISERDSLVAEGKTPHRVTEYFAGDSPDSLRSDMQAFAAGQRMSARLRAEFLSYSACVVDDTWAEAIHRDVSTQAKRFTCVSFPFQAATLRLQQNLDLVASLDANEAQLFANMFSNWKAVGQPNPRLALKLVKPRRSGRSVLESVYRHGRASIKDWAADPALRAVAPLLPDDPVTKLKFLDKLKADWLSMVMKKGCVYSAAILSDHYIIDEAMELPLCDAGQRLISAASGFVVFEVIDNAVRHKKQLKTIAWAEQRKMAVPVSIQAFAPANGQAILQDGDEYFCDGYPIVRDALQIAPWPVLRSTLRRHQIGQASRAHCVQLTGATLINSDSWDWRGSVPVIVSLERLADLEWSLCPKARSVTSFDATTSPKLFYVKDYFARRTFLQCLVLLPELMDAGLVSLPAGQPGKYYACVLQANQPGAVPCGQPAAFYAKLAKGGQAGENAGAEGALEDSSEAAGSDEDQVFGSFVSAIVAKPNAKAKEKRSADDQISAGSAVWPSRKRVRSQPSALDGQLQSQQADGFAQEAQGQLVESPDAASVDRPAPAFAGGAASGSASAEAAVVSAPDDEPAVPIVLEGVELRYQRSGVLGQPQAFRRWSAKCNVHAKCTLTRNIGVKTTKNFGPDEPIAYVGAWLASANLFPSAAEHAQHKPSIADVEKYMVSKR